MCTVDTVDGGEKGGEWKHDRSLGEGERWMVEEDVRVMGKKEEKDECRERAGRRARLLV
jgi:hypothetical protein